MKPEIYIILFLLAFSKASIVLKTEKNKITPESNKLQIQISRNSEPIVVETNNEVKSIHTNTKKFEIIAPEIDEENDNNVYNTHHSIYTEHENNENLTNNIDHEKSYDSHNLQHEGIDSLHEIVNSDHGMDIDQMNNITNEENINMLEAMHHELTRPLTKDEKNINIAYSQVEELEDNLTGILERNKNEENLRIDPDTLKSLVSYMEHLDYIKKHEERPEGDTEEIGLPPSLPDNLRAKVTIPELDEHGKLIPPTVKEEKVIDMNLVDKLHKEITELEEEIERAKATANMTDEEKLAMEEEKEKLEDELEREENETGGIQQKEEVEEEIEKINNTEEDLEAEGGHAETIVELEDEKHHLEEEDLELQDKEEKLDDLKVFEIKLRDIKEQLFEARHNEDDELVKKLEAEKVLLTNEKETLEQERINPDDQELEELEAHKKENENVLEIQNLEMGSADNDLKSNESGYIGEGKNYENIPNLLVVMQGISAAYNTLFEDMPDNKEEVPKDTTTQLKEGLEMYAKLRNFIVAMTANRDKLVKDINYVKDNFAELNLTHDEVLGFYDLKTRYDKNKESVQDKTTTFYLDNQKAIEKETSGFSENIKTLSQNAETLMSVDDLLFKETEYLRSNMDDDDTLDAIKKVDATILLLPKLIDFKIEIDTTISEIKVNLNAIESRRPNLVQFIDDFEKIQLGTYEAMKVDPLDTDAGIGLEGWSLLLVGFSLLI